MLDEPDSPARPYGLPGHRRSSSDSFTLFDGTTAAASAGMCGNVLDGIRTGGQVGSWGRTPEFFREPSSFGRPQGQGPPWDPRQMFLQGGGIPLPVRDSMPLPVREKNGGHHVVMLNGADMKGYGDASHNQIMVGAARNESDEHLKALSIRSRHQTRQTAICSEVSCPEAPIHCRAREKSSSLTDTRDRSFS